MDIPSGVTHEVKHDNTNANIDTMIDFFIFLGSVFLLYI